MRLDTLQCSMGAQIGSHLGEVMGKRIIRFFGVRMSPRLSALQVRFGRLIARLRRARAIAGEKAFADR